MNENYMSILLAELHKQGYPQAEFLQAEKILKINPNCSMLYIKWDEDGELLISSCRRDSSCPNKVLSVVRQASTLFGAWSVAEPMPFSGVSHFRKLAEWNNIVLAARDDKERGLYFVTWRYSSDRDGVSNGNYTTSFEYAKRDFIIRSDLLPKETIIAPEQVDIIRSTLRYRLENDPHLPSVDADKLGSLLSSLDILAESSYGKDK